MEQGRTTPEHKPLTPRLHEHNETVLSSAAKAEGGRFTETETTSGKEFSDNFTSSHVQFEQPKIGIIFYLKTPILPTELTGKGLVDSIILRK